MDRTNFFWPPRRNTRTGGPKSGPLRQSPIPPRLLVAARPLILLLLIFIAFEPARTNRAFALQASSAAEYSERIDPDTIKKLKVASTEHDLILLLIESGNYDRIEFEWKKVLDLRLGGKYEGAVAQSLLTIAYKLSEAKQLALAQRILDYTLAEVSFSNKNKADILKLEAYLFKEAGELEKAIETYRKANELFVKP